VYEEDLVIDTQIGTLFTGRRARVLLSADDLDSGVSPMTVVARGTSAPSAGEACIQDAGTTIKTGTGTSLCRVRYIAFPPETVNDALAADTAL
jgi:hypothetical protein